MGINIPHLPSKLDHHSLTFTGLISLLQTLTTCRSLPKIKQLHAHVITSGILSLSSFKPFTLRSNLASSYAFSNHLTYARHLFDDLRQPNLFLYNAIIRMYSQNGSPFEVLRLFVKMGYGKCLYPDKFTYPFVVKACGDLALLKIGVVLHGKVVVGGVSSDIYVLNSLLAMYMNCGDVEAARRVFYVMMEKKRDMVSWATMINGFVKNGRSVDALMIFDEMINFRVEVNRSSVVSVLRACGDLEDLNFGRKVHIIIDEKRLRNDVFVCNSLIDMYARCGDMDGAREVFDKMEEKDVVTWTSLMKGYILNGSARYALELCWEMHRDGVVPNAVTIATLLQGCGSLQAVKQGKCLHGWVVRKNLVCDAIIETSLIDMYAKCKEIKFCTLFFVKISPKRVTLWNAMISAYTQNGLVSDAVHCFKQMLCNVAIPDVITFSSLLCAYAKLGDGQKGFSVHSYLIKSGFLTEIQVGRGLVDLYSKCGNLEYSQKIFNEVSVKFRDITLWSALIAGYGTHGHGETAVLLFKQMIKSGVNPNEVTLTCVLDACSHAGLVDEGFDLFKLMLEQSQINPSMHHYTCLVDLLGRVGKIKEAYDFIITVPFMPNHAVWGSLLGSCVVHRNVEFGEIAAKSLANMEPNKTTSYVLLANIYASVGRWQDAENVRSMINDTSIGLGKTPGHSLVEGKVM